MHYEPKREIQNYRGIENGMSYLSDLRKIVGKKPLLTSGVTVLVFNEKKEILLNLRVDTIGRTINKDESTEIY